MALTIAGSDSGGGAGIQADLRTFAAHRVHGTTAICAVTAQNTTEVRAVHTLDPADVVAQIDAVVDDLRPAAVKTGMLATAAIIRAVASVVAHGRLPPPVVDPVMVASSGARLLEPEAEAAYLHELFGAALVITPNLREASLLVGAELRTPDDMREAAVELHRTGPAWVVIKGGHLEGDAVDVVYDGRRHTVLSAPRVATRNVHGTGCSFSAAIAANLARGVPAPEAIRFAKAFVHRALAGAAGWRLGAGHGPVDHLGWGRPSEP